MKKILSRISQWLISFRKFGNDIVDLFKPKNSVLILLKDPKTGKVLKTIKGRNIVTSFLRNSAGNPDYRSGTDVMRRLLIDPNSGTYGSESLQNANSASTGVYITSMELGVGNTPETSGDRGLAVPIGYNNLDGNGDYKGIAQFSGTTEPNARKTITMLTGASSVLDTTSTDVQFIAQWDVTELNGNQLSEVALITSPGTGSVGHFFARKTFTPFTKTSEFTLEIRWTIRF